MKASTTSKALTETDRRLRGGVSKSLQEEEVKKHNGASECGDGNRRVARDGVNDSGSSHEAS